MTSRLRIFHAEKDRSVPVLTIEVDREGKVAFTRAPDDPAAAAFVEALVRDGVNVVRPSAAEPNGLEGVRLTPGDGPAYVDAVKDMLGRTSRWIVVPE